MFEISCRGLRLVFFSASYDWVGKGGSLDKAILIFFMDDNKHFDSLVGHKIMICSITIK